MISALPIFIEKPGQKSGMNEPGRIPEFELVDFPSAPERILGFYLLPQLVTGLGESNPGEPCCNHIPSLTEGEAPIESKMI